MGVLFFQLENQGVGRGQVDVNNKKMILHCFDFQFVCYMYMR